MKVVIGHEDVARLHADLLASDSDEQRDAILLQAAESLAAGAEAGGAARPRVESLVRALGHLALVDAAAYDQRLTTCAGCEHARFLRRKAASDSGHPWIQCKRCLCIMNIKARLASMGCPVGNF
jgi:hypothetical protein